MNGDSPKVGFVSLGCPKNLVDAERILTQLRTEGYEVVPSYDDASLVIVNTCGFIDAAVAESMEAIQEALEENGKVIVTGCLGSKEEDIREVNPGVLAVTGPHQYEAVMEAVHEHLPQPQDHDPLIDLVPPQGVKLTPRHYAYLKISEGCNHSCSFCIIPQFRGKLASRMAGDVLGEAERLVASGVKELLVISQDTSAYGVDVKYKTDFWGGKPVKTKLYDLAEAMSSLGAWVRMHYVYPYPHVDNLIDLMADGKILPYLDVPLQHASPSVLKAMRRPAAAENAMRRIHAWREKCPDITLRSTFIVGFPGETEADFDQLLQFMEEAQLDRVGCFAYSDVDGARANHLPNHVPEHIARDRLTEFMNLQAEISANKLAQKVGRDIDVMIDGREEDILIGRSKGDAPDVDGNVFLETPLQYRPGDIIKARVVSSEAHDLWAEPIQ